MATGNGSKRSGGRGLTWTEEQKQAGLLHGGDIIRDDIDEAIAVFSYFMRSFYVIWEKII